MLKYTEELTMSNRALTNAIWENILDAVATSESDDEVQEQLAAYEQLLASPQRMRRVMKGIGFSLIDAVAKRHASLSTDAGGHQHKGKGEGGGQFTKASGGDVSPKLGSPRFEVKDGQFYFVPAEEATEETPPPKVASRPKPVTKSKPKPRDTTEPRTPSKRVLNPSSTLAAAYRAIDSNEDLSDEQRGKYAAAFEQVSANMPDAAHELIKDGLKAGGLRLYADPFEVMNGAWDEIEAHVQKHKSVWVKMMDFVFLTKRVKEAEKMARRNSTFMAPAAFSSATGGLHLDGGDLAEAPDLFGKDTHAQVLPHLYAHELTHVIDHNGRFSNTPEWFEAWQEEIADKGLLTEYGRTLLVEGFAEMGRAVYGGGTDLHEVERVMPKCSKFFKDNGLWPV